MSSEFFRLYRELCRSDAVAETDYSHLRERKDVMRVLGYDVGSGQKHVERSKHHGKAARRFAPQKRLKAIATDNKEEARRMKELYETSSKASDIQILTLKMQECVARSEKIPHSLWRKYNDIFMKNDGSSSNPPLSIPSPSKGDSIQLPTIHNSKENIKERSITTRRSDTILRKDFTENKWSLEERERLNAIYWILNKPSVQILSAWEQYYVEFASRFRAFYPRRSQEEIIVKIQEMISLRQMKEPGEAQYWKNIHKSGSV